jgi:hypothetical protein
MAAKQCPNCGLKNPVNTLVCDCGRSFVDGAMTEQRRYLPGKDPRSQDASGLLAVGLFVGGLVARLLGGALATELPAAGLLISILGVVASLGGLVGLIAWLVKVARRR